MVKLWLRDTMHARNKQRLMSRLLRMLRYRMIIPLVRSMDNPQLVARGVAIGLLLGFTPTVGLQMWLIFVFWLFSRKFLGWDFNPILAIAWSYLSNPLTMVPLYYVFYVTGSVMMGSLGSYSFSDFTAVMDRLGGAESEHFWTVALDFATQLWNNFGLQIFIGCLPYSVGGAILGYVWVMHFFVTRSRNKKSMGDPA